MAFCTNKIRNKMQLKHFLIKINIDTSYSYISWQDFGTQKENKSHVVITCII